MTSLAAAAVLSLALVGCSVAPTNEGAERAAAPRAPNIVLVLTDDQGYGDLGCYGHPSIRTPHIDALAASGLRLTSFYAGASVCTPSRAALLTGCYPVRVGLQERVVFPRDDHGLHPDEVTLAEVLRGHGYATGCFGKWHLGHRPSLLPTDQGFDEFFGVPYSNDMARFHRAEGDGYPYSLPLMRGAEVVEWEPDQRELTRRYTEEAVRFVKARADGPFFLYLPHSMPHVPLFASAAFEGRSAAGRYGDVIEELDWSVGQIVAALERAGVRDDTLILFTSDNGPWLQRGADGGSAGPLRGGKGTVFEGGVRVPCVVSWPGHVPAGATSDAIMTAMDVLPSMAAMVGAELDPERALDGRDLSPLLLGAAGALPALEALLYHDRDGALAAVRRGHFKLHLSTGALYDLEADLGERSDIAAAHPALVRELEHLARQAGAALEAAARPAGQSGTRLFDETRSD